MKASMPQESPKQRRTAGRVMHEFKHGELKSGPSRKGGKVKSRRQAIAIALREAGASKYESARENRENYAKTKSKEARGETAQQEVEGKSHVGARGRRESSPAVGGRNAATPTRRRHKVGASRTRGGPTKAQLYKEAQARHVEGRSRMSKRELENALR
jgi:hypothetical protein